MIHLQLLNQIKQGKLPPITYIYGAEPLFIDELMNAAEVSLLPEAERSFNQTVVYGRDVNVPQLVNMCMQYPMMAERQVVILKEAQTIKDKDWELMLTYFEKPMASTVLIIGSKVDKLDERKSSTKLIKKTCLMFNSEKVKDWKLAEWVRDYTRELGFEINPDATQLLCDHVGNNLSAIVNELKKIIINCGDKRKIGIKEITTYVGISNEYNAFEMLKSIAKKDKTRTFQIAEVLSAQPLILVFSAMFNYFSTVYVCHLHGVNNPYDAAKITGRPPNIAEEYLACMRLYNPTKTERILQIINQYDLKEKGVNNVNTSSKSLLFELIAKIFSL